MFFGNHIDHDDIKHNIKYNIKNEIKDNINYQSTTSEFNLHIEYIFLLLGRINKKAANRNVIRNT